MRLIGTQRKKSARVLGGAFLVFFAFGAAGDSPRAPPAADSSRTAAALAADSSAAGGRGFSYSAWLRDKRFWGGYRKLNGGLCARGESDDCPPPGKRQKRRGSFWRVLADGFGENALMVLDELPPGTDGMREAFLRSGNGEKDLTLTRWGRARLEGAVSSFVAGTGRSLAAAAQNGFGNWIRRAEVDVQTPFGGRRGQIGASAIGALREGRNGVLGWQARVFLGEGDGGNIGVFARTAKNGALWGANAFLDFQREDGGKFWRAGVGAEWRSRFGDIFVNRYFPLTGARTLANGDVLYSRAGLDAEAAIHLPGLEWVSLAGRYYRWRGRFGQGDESGRAYGLRFRPGGGLELDVFADGDGSGRWGADVRYRLVLSEDGSLHSAGRAPTFDPRAHFFDAVRREYGQRISRVKAGDLSFAFARAVFLLPADAKFRVKSKSYTVTSPGLSQTKSQTKSQSQSPLPNTDAPPTIALTLTLSVRTTVFLTAESPGANFFLMPPNPGTILLEIGKATLAFLAGGGEKAAVTLNSGVVSLSLPREFTSYLKADIASEKARMPVSGATIAEVACAPGAIASLWKLRAHCFSGGGSVAIGARRAAAIATMTLPAGAEAAVAPSHLFALARAEDLLMLSLAAENLAATLLTATVSASGVLLSPSSVFFTVSVSPVFAFAAEILRATITAGAGGAATLARFAAAGGFPPHIYSALSFLPAEFSLSADGFLFLTSAIGNPQTVSITVAANDSQTPPARATVAVTIFAVNPGGVVLNIIGGKAALLITGSALTATVSASGGYLTPGGRYLYRRETGGFINARINTNGIFTVLAGAAAGHLTATIVANDNHASTSPATVLLTVRVVDSFALGANDINAKITTRILSAATLARFSAIGGLQPYDYSAVSPLPAGISLAAGGLLLLTSAMDNPQTVSVTVSANDSQTPQARATVAVTVIFADPPDLTLSINRGANLILAGTTLTAATVVAAGGFINEGGEYSYRLLSDGVLANAGVNAEGVVTVSAGVVVGFLTATVIADDNHLNTEPGTVFVTVRVIDSFALEANDVSATVTTRIVSEGTLAVFAAVGGVLPYNYSAISSLPAGVSLAAGGLLLLTSAFNNPQTVSVTVAANDSQTPAARGTSAITVVFVNPPDLTLDIRRGAALIVSGMTLTAATVSASGGHLNSGGDYSYRLGSDGVLANAGVNADGVVTVSAGVVVGFLTATVIADDNHANTEPGTVFVTVRVIDSFALEASGVSGTITTQIVSEGTLALFAAVGGVLPYDYSAISSLPAVISLATDGRLHLTSAMDNPRTVSVTVAANDSQTPQARGTAAVTIIFADPPDLTLSINRGANLILAGTTLTAATVSVLGGFINEDGDYSYRLESNGVLAAAGVQADGVVTVSAGAVVGFLTATIIADDNHANTAPATVFLTARIINDFILAANNISATITTRILSAATLAQFSAIGGLQPHDYAAVSPLPAGISLAAGGLLLLTSAIDNPQTVSVTVSANDSQTPQARATVAVTVIFADPSPVAININLGAAGILAGATLTAATISVSGGHLDEGGEYSRRLEIGGAAANAGINADGAVTISAGTAAGYVTATIIADDNHANTAPATAFLTARIINIFAIAADNTSATITTRILSAATLAQFSAIGGLLPHDYSAVSPLPAGISLTGGLLLLTSAINNPQTTSITVAANDSQNPPKQATAAITIIFADPSPVTINITRGVTVVLSGLTATAATVSASGGHLDEGGEYSYRLEVGGVLAAAAIHSGGVLAISAGTVAGHLTATVVADDNHANTSPATAFLTVRIANSLALNANTTRATVTTHISGAATLARFAALGGLLPYAYSAARALPAGFAFSADGVLYLTASIALARKELFTVFVSDSQTPPHRATAAAAIVFVDPPEISLSLSARTTVARGAESITIVTLFAAGGHLPTGQGYRYDANVAGLGSSGISGNRFRIVPSVTGMFTAVFSADDRHPNTAPATASLVFRIAGDFSFSADGGGATITTKIVSAATLARFSSEGGFLPHSYNLASALPAGISFSAGEGLLLLTSSVDNPRTVSVTVAANDSQTPQARGTAAVTVVFVNPPELTLDIHRGAALIVSGMTLTAATVTASGGHLTSGGEYSYTLESDGVLAAAGVNADGVVTVSAGAVVGTLTATVIADDDHANTSPGTVFVTVRVIDSFALGASGVRGTVTTRIVGTATLARFAAAGGVLPYNYSAVSSLPTGVSLAAGGLLHLTSSVASPLTVSVTVAANDSQIPSARGTAAVTVVFVNPPALTLDIHRGATLITSGMTLTAATVSTSGGHLDSGGDYSYRLESDGVLANAGVNSDGVVTVSAGADAGFLTAAIIADDNHANTEPGTVFVTVRVINSFAPGARNISGTVTTRILGTATLARFAAEGGLPPYDYSAISSLPAGVSLAAGGLLLLTSSVDNPRTISVTVAANDSQTPAARGTSGITVVFVNPPALTIEINRGATLVTSGMTLTAATVSVSGGYLTSGGEYSYRLESGGVSANAGVDANGGVTISAGTVAGMLTATIIADDDHANTNPATAFLTASVFAPLSVGNLTVTFTQGVIAQQEQSNGAVFVSIPRSGAKPTLISFPQVACPTGMICRTFGIRPGADDAVFAFIDTPSVAGEFVSYALFNGALRGSVVAVVISPAPISLAFFRTAEVSARVSVLAGTVSVGGGYVTAGGSYSVSSPTPEVSVSGGDVYISVSAPTTLTATIVADDDNGFTEPASIMFTVSAVSDALLAEYATVSATAGVSLSPELLYINVPQSGGAANKVLLLDYAESIIKCGDLNLACAFYRGRGTAAVAVARGGEEGGPLPGSFAFNFKFIYNIHRATVTGGVFVTVAPPRPITAAFAVTAGAVLTRTSLGLGTLAASGGHLTAGGSYSYRLEAPAEFSLSGNTVSVSLSGTAPVAATAFADDDNAFTEPATVFFTVRAFLLSARAMLATVTTRIVSAATLARFSAAGGISPYNYSEVSSLPAGVSLAAGGLLLLTSAVDNARTVSVTVAANDSQTPPQRATAAIAIAFADPPAVTLDIHRGANVILAGATLTAATVSASGGFLTAGGDYSYRLESGGGLANAGVDADGVVTVSAGAVVGTLTATVIADDNHANTSPGTVFVTVRVVDSFMLDASGVRGTVTTRILGTATLALFAAAGGVSPYDYSAVSSLPAGISLADTGRLHLTSAMDNALTVSVTVAGNDSQTPAARGTAAVTVVFVNPPALTLDINRGATLITSGATLTAATVSAAGGFLTAGGEYSYRLESGGGLANAGVNADGIVTVLAGTVAGYLTATIIADDNHANTSPATAFLTVRIINSFALSANGIRATVTTRIASAATLASFAAAGGISPYGYAAVSPLPAGISLAAGGLLLLTSAIDNAQTVSATVAANDSQNPPRRATAAVVIVFADPPDLTLTIHRGASLIVSGAKKTAATVSVSGGFLTAGGEYSRRLQSGGVSAAAGIDANGVVTVSAQTAGHWTATIIADDNHANTSPATAFLTARFNISLFAPGATITVTAGVSLSLTATVTLQSEGGLKPVGGNFAAGLQCPFGMTCGTAVQTANERKRGLLFLHGDALNAGVFPMAIFRFAGGGAPPLSATATAFIKVLPALPITVLFSAAVSEVEARGGAVFLGTVSASGGLPRAAPGGYTLTASAPASGAASVSVFLRGASVYFSAEFPATAAATLIADDFHGGTSPGTLTFTITVLPRPLSASFSPTVSAAANATMQLGTVSIAGGLLAAGEGYLLFAPPPLFARGNTVHFYSYLPVTATATITVSDGNAFSDDIGLLFTVSAGAFASFTAGTITVTMTAGSRLPGRSTVVVPRDGHPPRAAEPPPPCGFPLMRCLYSHNPRESKIIYDGTPPSPQSFYHLFVFDDTVSGGVFVTVVPPSPLSAAFSVSGRALAGASSELGTVSVGGGFVLPGGSYSLSSDAAGISFAANTVYISVNNPRTVAATILADDDNAFTEPATVFFTVRVFSLSANTVFATVTTRIVSAATLARFSALGGLPPYRYSAAAVLPAGISLAADGLLHLTSRIASPLTAGVSVFADDSQTPPARAAAAVTIVFVDPPQISLSVLRGAGAILTGNVLRATASASGGYLTAGGEYSYRLESGGAAAAGINAGGVLTVSAGAAAGILRATIIANDHHENTSPATAYFTVHTVPLFTVTAANTIIATLTTHLPGTATALFAAGGLPPYFHDVLSQLPEGMGAVSAGVNNQLLLLTSGLTAAENVSATVAAGDSRSPPVRATVAVTIAIVDPPPISLSVARGEATVLTGAVLTAATLSLAGGFLTAGGEYSRDLQSGGVSAAAGINADGVFTVSAGADMGFFTATIINGDNHPNTAPATAIVTVFVFTPISVGNFTLTATQGIRIRTEGSGGAVQNHAFAAIARGGIAPTAKIDLNVNCPFGMVCTHGSPTGSPNDHLIIFSGAPARRSPAGFYVNRFGFLSRGATATADIVIRIAPPPITISAFPSGLAASARVEVFVGTVSIGGGALNFAGTVFGNEPSARTINYRVSVSSDALRIRGNSVFMSTYNPATVTATIFADDGDDFTAPAFALFTVSSEHLALFQAGTATVRLTAGVRIENAFMAWVPGSGRNPRRVNWPADACSRNKLPCSFINLGERLFGYGFYRGGLAASLGAFLLPVGFDNEPHAYLYTVRGGIFVTVVPPARQYASFALTVNAVTLRQSAQLGTISTSGGGPSWGPNYYLSSPNPEVSLSGNTVFFFAYARPPARTRATIFADDDNGFAPPWNVNPFSAPVTMIFSLPVKFPPLSVSFAKNNNISAGVSAVAGTASAEGGDVSFGGDYAYSIIAPPEFSLRGGEVFVSLQNPATLTATVVANDDSDLTEPASVVFAVSVNSFAPFMAGTATITMTQGVSLPAAGIAATLPQSGAQPTAVSAVFADCSFAEIVCASELTPAPAKLIYTGVPPSPRGVLHLISYNGGAAFGGVFVTVIPRIVGGTITVTMTLGALAPAEAVHTPVRGAPPFRFSPLINNCPVSCRYDNLSQAGVGIVAERVFFSGTVGQLLSSPKTATAILQLRSRVSGAAGTVTSEVYVRFVNPSTLSASFLLTAAEAVLHLSTGIGRIVAAGGYLFPGGKYRYTSDAQWITVKGDTVVVFFEDDAMAGVLTGTIIADDDNKYSAPATVIFPLTITAFAPISVRNVTLTITAGVPFAEHHLARSDGIAAAVPRMGGRGSVSIVISEKCPPGMQCVFENAEGRRAIAKYRGTATVAGVYPAGFVFSNSEGAGRVTLGATIFANVVLPPRIRAAFFITITSATARVRTPVGTLSVSGGDLRPGGRYRYSATRWNLFSFSGNEMIMFMSDPRLTVVTEIIVEDDNPFSRAATVLTTLTAAVMVSITIPNVTATITAGVALPKVTFDRRTGNPRGGLVINLVQMGGWVPMDARQSGQNFNPSVPKGLRAWLLLDSQPTWRGWVADPYIVYTGTPVVDGRWTTSYYLRQNYNPTTRMGDTVYATIFIDVLPRKGAIPGGKSSALKSSGDSPAITATITPASQKATAIAAPTAKTLTTKSPVPAANAKSAAPTKTKTTTAPVIPAKAGILNQNRQSRNPAKAETKPKPRRTETGRQKKKRPPNYRRRLRRY